MAHNGLSASQPAPVPSATDALEAQCALRARARRASEAVNGAPATGTVGERGPEKRHEADAERRWVGRGQRAAAERELAALAALDGAGRDAANGYPSLHLSLCHRVMRARVLAPSYASISAFTRYYSVQGP
jgi:hypothetical protein